MKPLDDQYFYLGDQFQGIFKKERLDLIKKQEELYTKHDFYDHGLSDRELELRRRALDRFYRSSTYTA